MLSWRFGRIATSLATGYLTLCVLPILGATRIDLNGEWQFKLDPTQQGQQQGWSSQSPSGTETVRVPHTWNIGKYEDFEGTAWYFKTFMVPGELRSKHVEIHFGATFYRSRVWLNGVEVGGHEGGHTAYFFDVTPHLKPTYPAINPRLGDEAARWRQRLVRLVALWRHRAGCLAHRKRIRVDTPSADSGQDRRELG
jgi:hypothetical protein